MSKTKGTPARDRAPLPAEVARLLSLGGSRAPDAKRVSSWGSRALALVPVGVTVLVAALVFPRAVPPSEVPLPLVDARSLADVERHDGELVARAKKGLSDDTRLLGSAIRDFLSLQASPTPPTDGDVLRARDGVQRALVRARGTAPAEVELLRAIQLDIFLRAIVDYERTGVEPPELREVGGSFLKRMSDVGWVVDGKLLPSRSVRSTLFKLAWAQTAGVAGEPDFEPSLDELRELHAFYIRHPHASETRRRAIAEARKLAKDRARCDELAALERAAVEEFRLEKVKKLGALDPSYPTTFAQGVVLYRQGRFSASAEAFRDWLRTHPDGSLALRAQNHLRAAVEADARL